MATPAASAAAVPQAAGHIIDELSLTNIAGQEVLYKNTIGSKTTGIDISAFDSGMYFVRIKTAAGTGIVKLAIEK
jgi:hypothetical protein